MIVPWLRCYVEKERNCSFNASKDGTLPCDETVLNMSTWLGEQYNDVLMRLATTVYDSVRILVRALFACEWQCKSSQLFLTLSLVRM